MQENLYNASEACIGAERLQTKWFYNFNPAVARLLTNSWHGG